MRKIWLFVLLLIVLTLAGCSLTSGATQTPAPPPTPTSTPTPTPEPTPEPTPAPPTPEELEAEARALEQAKYYTDGEEQVTVDVENGYWLYKSSTLFVEINQFYDEEELITYFVAEVKMKEGETERAGFAKPDDPGDGYRQLYKIVRDYQAVVAVNGDFMDAHEPELKGIIIRDGVIHSNKTGADTLAFYPDGSLRIITPNTITADELINSGVSNTYSFGPTLIDNGKIQEGLAEHRVGSKKPRTAIGMLEPYHYFLVVVEGRDKPRSVGMTMEELAQLFADLGCQVAYNLDGGKSATMAFLGEHVNIYQGDPRGQRAVPDALMFGYTPLLAEEED